ncbi:mCG1028376, isoform CRA_b, partial [Mus musculus]
HVQRSAQPGAAASAPFSVRCFPTLLPFEAFPNNRTQRSQHGSQHARPGSPAPPRESPSPTWVENPQRAGQQPNTALAKPHRRQLYQDPFSKILLAYAIVSAFGG